VYLFVGATLLERLGSPRIRRARDQATRNQFRRASADTQHQDDRSYHFHLARLPPCSNLPRSIMCRWSQRVREICVERRCSFSCQVNPNAAQ
jgi:hypothetical protein